MSAYFDEYGNLVEPQQQVNFDPVNQAFWENPAQVVALAAKMAADQAAASVGQAVHAEQGWQLEQARAEAAKAADQTLTENFGVGWERDKSRFAQEWLAPRPEYLTPELVMDADQLAATLGAGYRLWKTQEVEEAQRLQTMDDKEFKDSIVAAAQEGSYASRMANADFQSALRDVQR